MMPGVSRKMTWCASPEWMPIMRCRVVCGFRVTMDSFSPSMALRRVLLPTFGFPTMAT
jgi:hypothetical protein